MSPGGSRHAQRAARRLLDSRPAAGTPRPCAARARCSSIASSAGAERRARFEQIRRRERRACRPTRAARPAAPRAARARCRARRCARSAAKNAGDAAGTALPVRADESGAADRRASTSTSARRSRSGGTRDRRLREPVEEILAKASCAHVGRRDRDASRRRRARPRARTVLAAHPPHLAGLEHAQQLRLQRERRVADLVEQAACRHAPARRGPARVCTAPVKAPRSWPKSSASSSPSASSVTANETSARASALLVQRTRDDFLADARLAEHQHARAQRRETPDPGAHAPRSRPRPRGSARRRAGSRRRTAGRASSACAIVGSSCSSTRNGYSRKCSAPATTGAEHHLRVGACAVEDERHLADAPHRAQQAESVESRHAVIRQHDVDRLRLEARQRLERRPPPSARRSPKSRSAAPSRSRVAAWSSASRMRARVTRPPRPVRAAAARSGTRCDPAPTPTASEPPCAVTTSRHSASPSPKPLRKRADARLEDLVAEFGRNPAAVVLDLDAHAPGAPHAASAVRSSMRRRAPSPCTALSSRFSTSDAIRTGSPTSGSRGAACAAPEAPLGAQARDARDRFVDEPHQIDASQIESRGAAREQAVESSRRARGSPSRCVRARAGARRLRARASATARDHGSPRSACAARARPRGRTPRSARPDATRASSRACCATSCLSCASRWMRSSARPASAATASACGCKSAARSALEVADREAGRASVGSRSSRMTTRSGRSAPDPIAAADDPVQRARNAECRSADLARRRRQPGSRSAAATTALRSRSARESAAVRAATAARAPPRWRQSPSASVARRAASSSARSSSTEYGRPSARGGDHDQRRRSRAWLEREHGLRPFSARGLRCAEGGSTGERHPLESPATARVRAARARTPARAR